MNEAAPDAFVAWVTIVVAPIARANGLAGKGPTFRRRHGEVWAVFGLERRRRAPRAAGSAESHPMVDFRVRLGYAIPRLRPAWDTRTGPPGVHDCTVYAPTTALEPAEVGWWHVFDPADDTAIDRLSELVRAGLPAALEALGPADPRAILDAKLPWMGPLENLSPGGAEELLALADLAGAADVRETITAALQRPRVPDPVRDRAREWSIDDAAAIFGPGVGVAVLRPPRDEEIAPPVAGRRRTPKIRTRLIGELDASSPEIRRSAASALGAWTDDEEVRRVLRTALANPDDFTRVCAVRSLGHLRDDDGGTWAQALAIAADTESGPTEVAEAVVLLSRLDASRREAAVAAIAGLLLRFPANARRLTGLGTLVAGGE